jgi:peptidoglycan/xylan/chitin deacetylase (PgdA/CDA1 family)
VSGAVRQKVFQRVASRLRARGSVVLLYHGVGPSNQRTDPGFLRVARASFEVQLDVLMEAGFEFLTVAELAKRIDGAEPPPGLVALSFDDGMDDNHRVVLPVLRERGLRATVYVATGLIGKPNPWMARDSGARMMTVEELGDLVCAGFEIGAHSVTHPDFSRLTFADCLREASESKLALERLLDIPVRTFAYPYCFYGPAAVAAVRAAGFDAAVTCQGLGSWDRYELKRSLVSGKDGIATFLLKVGHLYEPLATGIPGRAARAVTRRARAGRRNAPDSPSPG